MSQFSENKRPGRLPEDESRSPGPDLTVDEKPFRLAKSFSLAAIVLIFASVLALAAVVSRQAEIIITKRVEDDTVKLMTNLNFQMYVQFLRPVSEWLGKVSLGEPNQREWLSDIINRTIFGFDLEGVIIYNEDGQAVFSTDDELSLPMDADDPEAIDEAVHRYTTTQRVRFASAERIRPKIVQKPEFVESQPEPDQTDPEPEDVSGGQSAEPTIQPPLTGRKYELPSPYQYFNPSLYGRDDSPEKSDDQPGEQATAAPGFKDGTSGAENVDEELRTDSETLADSEADPTDEAGKPGYRAVIVAGVKLWEKTPRLPVADPNSPAAAEMVEGSDEDFRNYQRSVTVFRHEGGSYLLFNFLPAGEFVLRAYKVMESYEAAQGPGVSGILEITRDLTPEYKQIARLQYFALGVAIFLSLVLTVALRWVVSRGEAILNKRNLERQALREQLDQAERLAGLGSMVATVAHEIRNPLGIIHSTADVLGRFLAKDPDQARLARAIVEEADRLSTVVTEFLDFARPPQPNLAPIVVEEILEEILAFLEITLARAGVEIRCDLRPDPAPVMGDGPMLHRAFLNIIMNAVQAMDDGGLLTVNTRLEKKDGGDWLTVSVSDTGPGLSEETAKKMFSPFYTTKAKGTGLGLVIVRNIVEGHGGEIEMVSRPPSKKDDAGLTVIIHLKVD